MAELQLNNQNSGTIQIADEVIAAIAAAATLETEGVSALVNNFPNGIIEKLTRKNINKGVVIIPEENEIGVSINIMMKTGAKIHETAYEVQRNVKTAIETMTGLKTVRVDINVAGVETEKNKTDEETAE